MGGQGDFYGIETDAPAGAASHPPHYMLKRTITYIFFLGLLTSCIHTPSYYASLEKITYSEGKALFSENISKGEAKYGSLVLREDGACSIIETINGRDFRGGGAWWKTKHKDIIRVGLSSNSPATIYHFYVRLNDETMTYVVSDEIELLLEL